MSWSQMSASGEWDEDTPESTSPVSSKLSKLTRMKEGGRWFLSPFSAWKLRSTVLSSSNKEACLIPSRGFLFLGIWGSFLLRLFLGLILTWSVLILSLHSP